MPRDKENLLVGAMVTMLAYLCPPSGVSLCFKVREKANEEKKPYSSNTHKRLERR